MSADVVCTRCGHRNHGGSTFCASCGSFLEWTATDDLDPVPEKSVLAVASSERVDATSRLAAAADRNELTSRLHATADRLRRPVVPVAVVGQYKVGKSRLVNSIVNAEVCPADPLVGSVVPTIVEYGDDDNALVALQNGEQKSVPTDEVAAWVTEDGNAANRRAVVSVRVPVRKSFLLSGLQLVDTPGLGGLDSPAGRLLASSVERAAGVLLVTSAVQEITKPELDFLDHVVNSGVDVAVVVSKTDLVGHWRRIVSINEGHLRSAGMDVPVLPVSAPVRRRAAAERDAVLNDESGYPAVLAWLADVARNRADHEARRADRQLRDATAQMRAAARVAEEVLEKPERAEPVIRRLEAVASAAGAMTAQDADWRSGLTTTLDDLRAWTSGELGDRLGAVQRQADLLLDREAGAGAWAEIEAWVRREATDECVDLLGEFAARLVAVSERVDAEVGLEIPIAEDDDWPTVGSLGARLMVGEAGQLLVLPVDAPPALHGGDAASGADTSTAALRGLLTDVRQLVEALVSEEIESAAALVEHQIEVQSGDLARSAETTVALAEAARNEAPEARSLSLAQLRRQLEGLDAIDAELAATGTTA